ncbi:hypothetical protein QJS10_CPB11g02072 [Acorus calamus]|uniref:Uncharacterized protein n=1 Tax=Acorus calamus TaxID=4465 RepID=A0AAV9DVJ0_ACOCL|nr:hypothetical protein QJS10_CPB11g02072 [Acorus calamus]
MGSILYQFDAAEHTPYSSLNQFIEEVSFRILSNDQNSSRGADGESGRRTDQSEVDMFFLDKRAREVKITVPGASHVRGGRDGRLPCPGILVVRFVL